MANTLADRMIVMHLTRGTDPHPPRGTSDPEYAKAYEITVRELAARRA